MCHTLGVPKRAFVKAALKGDPRCRVAMRFNNAAGDFNSAVLWTFFQLMFLGAARPRLNIGTTSAVVSRRWLTFLRTT